MISLCYNEYKNSVFKMKSLKEIPSVNQISWDYLLNISRQPKITCPLINTLQFSGTNKSRIERLSIEINPIKLILDTDNLLTLMSDLEKWSTDILDLSNSLLIGDLENIDDNMIIQMEELTELMKKSLKIDYFVEIENQSNTINSCISEWLYIHNDYTSINNKINAITMDIENSNNESDDLITMQLKLKESESLLVDYQSMITTLENTFENSILGDFIQKTNDFSDFLEIVRTHNDNLRSISHELESCIISIKKSNFSLLQPIDYLKRLETGSSNEISLGILKSDERDANFQDLCQYLKNNGVIEILQADILSKTKSAPDLFELLKTKGYEIIRYYETKDHFLTDKESYKEIINKDKKKMLLRNQF